MNMKKFVKKPLVIAALMLASGGMVNMVHAATTINSKDISATKTVKEGGGRSQLNSVLLKTRLCQANWVQIHLSSIW